jgi:RNA polymerase sigma factor (TIGR02999 family)
MSAKPAAILACTMTHPDAGEITRLLHAHHHGDRDAFDRLVPMVYSRLRQIASGQLSRRGRGAFLETTSLVHEAYLRLVDDTSVDWRDRGHFFAVCALAMRRIIVDYARQQTAKKRTANDAQGSLQAHVSGDVPQAELILAVDRAIDRLATFNVRLARIVECRAFAGMTDEETAQALETSVRTVQREWSRARAWLRTELEGFTDAGERATPGLRQ